LIAHAVAARGRRAAARARAAAARAIGARAASRPIRATRALTAAAIDEDLDAIQHAVVAGLGRAARARRRAPEARPAVGLAPTTLSNFAARSATAAAIPVRLAAVRHSIAAAGLGAATLDTDERRAVLGVIAAPREARGASIGRWRQARRRAIAFVVTGLAAARRRGASRRRGGWRRAAACRATARRAFT
jgi:hypothetical protein